MRLVLEHPAGPVGRERSAPGGPFPLPASEQLVPSKVVKHGALVGVAQDLSAGERATDMRRYTAGKGALPIRA